METGDWYDDSYVITETQYKNDGFTLELPATVPAKYLEPLWEDDMGEVTISDKTVKGTGIYYLYAYDKDDEELGWLAYMSANPSDDEKNMSEAIWIYFDKNVTINGQYKEEYVNESYNEEYITKYNNVTFTKGWNIAYMSQTYTYNQSTKRETYTSTVSTQKPSGVTLKWYFYSYDYENYTVK